MLFFITYMELLTFSISSIIGLYSKELISSLAFVAKDAIMAEMLE